MHNVQAEPHRLSSNETPAPIILDGMQQVTKFNRTSPDDVRILVALFRIENKNVDLVFSANLPTKAEDGGAIEKEDIEVTKDCFLTAARSLQIIDFSLFA